VLGLSYIHHSVCNFGLPAMLPDIARDLQLTNTQGATLTSWYSLVYALALTPAGTLADRVSRPQLLSIAAVAWSILTILAALSDGFEQLLILRLGFAIAQAAQNPVCFTLIPELFPKNKSLALAAYNGAMYLGRALSFYLLLFAATVSSWLHEEGLDKMIEKVEVGKEAVQKLIPLDSLSTVDLTEVSVLYVTGDMVAVAPMFDYANDSTLFTLAAGEWRALLFVLAFPGFLGASLLALTLTDPAGRSDLLPKRFFDLFRVQIPFDLLPTVGSLSSTTSSGRSAAAAAAAAAAGAAAGGGGLLDNPKGVWTNPSTVIRNTMSGISLRAKREVSFALRQLYETVNVIQREGPAGALRRLENQSRLKLLATRSRNEGEKFLRERGIDSATILGPFSEWPRKFTPSKGDDVNDAVVVPTVASDEAETTSVPLETAGTEAMTSSSSSSSKSQPNMLAAASTLFQRPAFVGVCAAAALVDIGGWSMIAFHATFYETVFELPHETYAPLLALCIPIGGIVGGVGGGFMGDKLSQNGKRSLLTGGATALAAPFLGASFLAPSYPISFGMLVIGFALAECWRSNAAVIVREVSPPELSSSAVGLWLTMRNAFAAAGPLGVAALSGHMELKYAMMVVPSSYLAGGIAFWWTERQVTQAKAQETMLIQAQAVQIAVQEAAEEALINPHKTHASSDDGVTPNDTLRTAAVRAHAQHLRDEMMISDAFATGDDEDDGDVDLTQPDQPARSKAIDTEETT